MDLVLNHCSDEHVWFRRALADPECEEASYFYFRESHGAPPNNWRSMFGGSAWENVGGDRWYLHLFSKKQPPSFIRFIEKYIPPMIMAILLVYCMKDVNFVKSPFGLPQMLSLALTIILHLWKNNSMLSIFGGTIAFMVLQRIF